MYCTLTHIISHTTFILSDFFRFDYGEKFWVIKHKQFTCHCTSDKCRYNKSNIQGFLKEYYRRMGEPMPPPDHPPSKTTTPAANPSSGMVTNATILC